MSGCYDFLRIYEQGLERKRKQLLKHKKGFKLLWLPLIARNEVVRSMDIREILKLSMSSRKTGEMVRYSKVKVNSIEVHVDINNSILQIESLNKDFYQCSPDHQKKGSTKLGPQIFSRLIDKNSSSFKNCVSIFKHLQNIFSFKSLHLHVNFEGMTVQFFREILTEPVLKDFEFLRIDKGEIDAECLDLVMKTAHSNRDLHIRGTRVPEDYYHENAFKFYDIVYGHADWVRIEHLFSLKDCSVVRLLKHRLTYYHLNTFIKFWIDNDHDMVQLLRLSDMHPFHPEILFYGIAVFQVRRRQSTYYLVAANPTKQRKHPIMGVTWQNKVFHLHSWCKDDTWEAEYEILLILNKKKELEGKLERIQRMLETYQYPNIVEKKNEISREIQTVSDDLVRYNLVFRDGVYSYNLT